MTLLRAPFRPSPFAKAMLLFSFPLAAWAQESAPETASATRLGEVTVNGQQINNDYNAPVSTVGAKTPTPIRDIPQQVTVVNRAVMDAQGATSLESALRYVPGITFTAAEGGTIGNNINLRGFSARTDIYLDTFRDRGQYYRDTFFLDSIEVLQGPSSMLFGRGSTGGIINQSSKLPSRTPHDEVSVLIGTSDQYRFTGDFDHTLNDAVAVRVPVMAQTVHSTRDVMHNQDYGAAPSLRVDLSPKTVLTVSTLLEHNHDMPDYGLPPLNNRPAPVSRDNFYGLTDDTTRQDVQVLNGSLKYQLAPELTLRNQAQYSKYRIDARETAANSVGTCSANPCTNANFTVLPTKAAGNTTDLSPDDLFVQLGSHDRNIHDSSAFDQGDVTWKVATGPLDHLLIAGFELGRDTYKNQAITLGNLPVLSLTDPQHISGKQAGVTLTPGNLAQADATTYAAFVNDTVSLGEHFKAVGGVRWDRYDSQITNTISTTTTAAAAQQTVYYDSVRGGLLYQPDDAQTYYVSYGTSFDPSLEQLTLTNGTQNVPPEKNRSYEVGSKWSLFGDNLGLTAALFQIEKTNARSQVEPGVYTLDGTIRVNGAELTASGRITPKWQVFSGYTYLDPEIVKASSTDGTKGHTPSNTPRNNATLWTTYMPWSAWEAGTGLVYSSSRYVNTTNVVSVPGFTRWDATLAFHQQKYDVRLNLQNLTNTHYFDSLIQSDGGRSVPGITRTALVSLNYRF
ncbi:MAG: TonB-dependent siderophore receptor [Nevskia sp.]|nr:TonB-dependent siderophore receptor [Nevskia sp.]